MNNTQRFKDKNIFVTGASRGIGRSIAEAFSSEGAWVIGTYTGKGNVPGKYCHEWFKADFSEKIQIMKCSKFLSKSKPDVLINNAGINKNAPFDEIDPKIFMQIQQVNVFAPQTLYRWSFFGAENGNLYRV